MTDTSKQHRRTQAMTVKELIKQLKKLDRNTKVSWAAHDNSEAEIGGDIHAVEYFEHAVYAFTDETPGPRVILSS